MIIFYSVIKRHSFFKPDEFKKLFFPPRSSSRTTKTWSSKAADVDEARDSDAPKFLKRNVKKCNLMIFNVKITYLHLVTDNVA